MKSCSGQPIKRGITYDIFRIGKISLGRGKYYVHFTRSPIDIAINSKIWVDFNRVVLYQCSFEEDDLYSMMDFTLDTEDRGDELQGRLPVEFPF
ncbi:hypothetical protein HNP81_004637 [Peribacillus huizhouensis]|uniref:Uncharacterized protein n=1 Tax=Peribacillus huizhouensis TaxID=1501239 RepID=A0ABR6CXC4_9BACI|nr:hypothetical protein [Peribacillus huizhouensis]